MLKDKLILLGIEKKTQVTEVRNLNEEVKEKAIESKVLSYQEFSQTYQEEEGIIDSYRGEFESWDSIKSYGPGNSMSQEKKRWTKFGVSTGVTVACIACPPLTVPVTIAAGTTTTVGLIARVSGDDSETAQFIKDVGDVGFDVLLGQGVGKVFQCAGSEVLKKAWSGAAQTTAKTVDKVAGKVFGEIAAREIAQGAPRIATAHAARQATKVFTNLASEIILKSASALGGGVGKISGHALERTGSALYHLNEQKHEKEKREIRERLETAQRELEEARRSRDNYYQRWQTSSNANDADYWYNKYQEEKARAESLEIRTEELENQLKKYR